MLCNTFQPGSQLFQFTIVTINLYICTEIQRVLEGRQERQAAAGDSNPREGERPLARRGDALHGDGRTETRRLSPVTMATTHTRRRQGT